MLPRNHPDRIQITFDDRRLVANPGCSFRPLTSACPTRPAAPRPGRCPGAGEHERQDDDAGGDCIDDADVLRTGGTASTLGGTVKAPPWTFLRSFRWGHAQLDRVSRELLARAWQAGAGPGDGPLTIDLDSTICETYGLAKEGARHHGYTGKRGYHPLLAIAAGTGDVVGPGQHRPRRRPLLGTGALRRGQRTTHATGRQRVLHWRGNRFSITIRTISSRYPKMPGLPFTGWTAPPMGRDHLHPLRSSSGG